MITIRTTTRVLGTAALLASVVASAASPAAKKLYCWDQNGHKVCGDALPPEAAAQARTVFSVKSGRETGNVARPLTPEERAAAAVAAAQTKVAADADAARQRRDLAMVESYGTEDDLRRAYGERTGLLDASLKASALGEQNLRLSLTSLLDQASDLELAAKPVPPTLLNNLRNQHAELAKQQRIMAQQQHDRTALEGELADAVARYRALKHAQADAANGTTVVTPAAAPGTPSG